MPRLLDAVTVVHKLAPWPLVKRVWRDVQDDNLVQMSAALAYSWLFALFPFLIFVMTLIPYMPEDVKQTATQEIPYTLDQYLPKKAADTIWEQISAVMTR